MKRNVYLYHPSTATYIGNGGMVWVSQVTSMLDNLGYDVYVFDGGEQGKHLELDDFKWTCNNNICIADLEQVLDDKDGVVIGTWLRTLMPIFEQYPHLLEHFIFRDAGHLLRAEMIAEREFAIEHDLKIAIMNPGLEAYYRTLGISPWSRWNYWVENFFQPKTNRGTIRIGVQTENNEPSLYTVLCERFGKDNIIRCDGNRRDVADKMAYCDIFLSWNTPAMLIPGDGESFGRTLSEAMMCDCALVARRSVGNLHYTFEDRPVFLDSVLFYDRLAYALDSIGYLTIHPTRLHIQRNVVMSHHDAFRLSDAHIQPIVKMVDNV